MTVNDRNRAKKLLEDAGWEVTDFGEYIQIELGIVYELTKYNGKTAIITDEGYLIELPN